MKGRRGEGEETHAAVWLGIWKEGVIAQPCTLGAWGSQPCAGIPHIEQWRSNLASGDGNLWWFGPPGRLRLHHPRQSNCFITPAWEVCPDLYLWMGPWGRNQGQWRGLIHTHSMNLRESKGPFVLWKNFWWRAGPGLDIVPWEEDGLPTTPRRCLGRGHAQLKDWSAK